MNSSKKFALALSVAGFIIATSASAETLPVSGVYAAGDDAPSQFRSLVIESFEGNEAAKMVLELRDAIGVATIDGEPYFDVRTQRGPGEGSGAVGWISGTAFSEVERLDAGSTEVKKCVGEDENGNCVKWRASIYDCKSLNVSFRAEVNLMNSLDDAVYSRGFSNTETERYCANQSDVPSAVKMITDMTERFAWQVRRDLAPIERQEDIRVLEKRKGMEKSLHKPFKQALRLTKTDWRAACGEFSRLHSLQPEHVTLKFNAGLCREAQGELLEASYLYRDALELGSNKDNSTEGLARLTSRWKAEEQIAMHELALVDGEDAPTRGNIDAMERGGEADRDDTSF